MKSPILLAAVVSLVVPTLALADDTPSLATTPPVSVAAPSTSVMPPPGDSATGSAYASQQPATDTVYQSVRPNKPLLYTGGILLLATYATTAGVTAASSGPNKDSALYIPIAGPWLHLGKSSATRTDKTLDTVLVAGSGVLQGAGAALMIASLFVPERVPTATVRAGSAVIHFTPASFGTASAGVGAVGTF